MNIIRDGNIDYEKKKYTGMCVNCGCEFETAINIVRGNALTRFVPEKEIEITRISGDKISCSCPQCEYKYVLLKETEE